MILATIRSCSAKGGIGTKSESIVSELTLGILIPNVEKLTNESTLGDFRKKVIKCESIPLKTLKGTISEVQIPSSGATKIFNKYGRSLLYRISPLWKMTFSPIAFRSATERLTAIWPPFSISSRSSPHVLGGTSLGLTFFLVSAYVYIWAKRLHSQLSGISNGNSSSIHLSLPFWFS